MNTNFEVTGRWFRPDNPDLVVSGVLSYSRTEGAELTVYGSLDADPLPKLFAQPDLSASELIVGIATDGKVFTLVDCFSSGKSLNMIGGWTTRFKSSYVVIGAHFQGPKDVQFTALSINYASLEEWMDASGFAVKHEEIFQGKLTVEYARPEALEMPLGGFTLRFEIAGPSISADALHEVRVGQRAWIRLSSECELDLDDYLKIHRRIQDFLSIAMGRPTTIVTIQAMVAHAPDSSDGVPPKDIRVEVLIPDRWPYMQQKPIGREDMLFSMPDVATQLPELLNKWLSSSELLQPVYDLYFSVIYNPYLYVENTFLSHIQALETYHRMRYGGKYQSDEDYLGGLYVTLRDSIPAGVDKNFRQSLVLGRLRYANEYSLRKRLQDLLDILAKDCSLTFGDDAFVNQVSDTRNYLTHYDTALKGKAATGRDLYELTQQLRALLEVVMLREFGIEGASIRTIFMGDSRRKRFVAA